MHEYLLKLMRRRNAGGPVLAAANASPAAGTVDLTAASGVPGIAAGNASTALAGVTNERVTSFISGLKPDSLEALCNFMFPGVPSGLKFDYRVANRDNVLMVADNDLVGLNGLPAVITFDGDTFQTGTLQFRGLEFPISEGEEAAWNAMPGWSAQMEINRRAQMLRQAIIRGRALRGLTLFAAAAATGGAQALLGTANPVPTIKADIQTVAEATGDRSMVRAVIGSSVWGWLTDHPMLLGGSQYPAVAVTKQRVADLLELPVENIMVSYSQMCASKQGKASAKSYLFAADEAYYFGASQSPGLDDASAAKTFYLASDGQMMSAYDYQPHPTQKRTGLKYYEKIVVTNAAAIKHRQYTYAAS